MTLDVYADLFDEDLDGVALVEERESVLGSLSASPTSTTCPAQSCQGGRPHGDRRVSGMLVAKAHTVRNSSVRATERNDEPVGPLGVQLSGS